MEKLILTIAIAILSITSKAQDLPLDTTDRQISYNAVIETPGNKDELYVKARSWFVTAFKSSNYVLQMDDKESGKLIGKGVAVGDIKDAMNIATLGAFQLNYTVYITVKDGKYRYEINDFNSEDLPGRNVWSVNKFHIYDLVINPDNRKSNGKWKNKYASYILLTAKTGSGLEKSIKEYMSSSSNASKKDNF